VFLAISSTVAKVTGTSETPADATGAVVLDLGHHQYNGRYILALRGVKEDLRRDWHFLQPCYCRSGASEEVQLRLPVRRQLAA